MRLNKFIAQATLLSRRKADMAIANGRVKINGVQAEQGQLVKDGDKITLDGSEISAAPAQTVMLNKPVGYVCSRDGQGSKTVYDLLPANLRNLKPVGRLDKDSSGLLLLTNDGQLANQLTHPRYQKQKIYEVLLNNPLTKEDQNRIQKSVKLDDGPSKLRLNGSDKNWTVTMNEGRNRQIRRTFAALGYQVEKLHRTQFGPYTLGELPPGKLKPVD